MILYIENPKDSTKKLLELINEFSKIAGSKINIKKLVAFLHTSDELSDRDINNPSTLTSKRIKYPGKNAILMN